VNEGLFLLDKDLKVGSERSLALNNIFRREEFAGITFDQLLKEIVPEKTLRTAMDYVALLWGDRVNEKLVKTINPLNEVEVHFDNASGGFDTHFLEFDFNRVKAEGSLSHLLVTVNDVTKRVMLSRELQESQEKAQAQLDLLLRILHVEPDNLTGFLTDADVSLKMVNSILKEPAREESAFRAKIDGIYRQVHAVKGEAAALGLKTVEQRAHAFEEALSDLKGRQSLSGSDFLPLVVKLDDLFNHLAQVREMLSRLVDLHQAIASRRGPGPTGGPATPQIEAEKVDRWLAGESDEPQAPTHDKTMSLKQPVFPAAEAPAEAAGGGLERTLADLAARVASSQAKQVALKCNGLDNVPESYRRAVKDITIQLVRNAVVHGIEEPSERAKAHKAEVGTLAVEFGARDSEGYELIVQDDGRGLQLERIKEVAVERGLITPGQAAMLDPRQTMALIFRPGFSTADRVTTDAGRGAGMDLVRILVAELGGRVGLASAGGKFSKFKIWLPAERAVAA
jgi:two-component system chemotaxis sensor kinase CheA